MQAPTPPNGRRRSAKARPTLPARKPPGLPDGQTLMRQLREFNHGLASSVDPFGIAEPILHAQLAWLMHPQELGERMTALSTELGRLQWHTWRRALGLPSPDPVGRMPTTRASPIRRGPSRRPGT